MIDGRSLRTYKADIVAGPNSPRFPAPVRSLRGHLSCDNFVASKKQALVDLGWILIFGVSQQHVEHEAKQVRSQQVLVGVTRVGGFGSPFRSFFRLPWMITDLAL